MWIFRIQDPINYNQRKEITAEEVKKLLLRSYQYTSYRCNISDGDAVKIVSAVSEVLGQDILNLAISRSTV